MRAPLLLALALSACGADQPAGPGNGPGSPGISAAAARTPAGRVRTLDDDLSDLAGEIPGFGGIFHDENGTLMVRLKDEAQMATARQRVEAFLTRRAQRNPARMAQVAREMGGMRALPAPYDFRELRAMYLRDVVPVARVEDGVTMTDIDERANRLVIGVRDAGMVPAMVARMRARGLPEEAFEVRPFDAAQIGPASVQDGECNPEFAIEPCDGGTGGGGGSGGVTILFNLDGVVRPVVGGVREQFLNAALQPVNCTLGYNVRPDLGSDPTRYFMTNAHCGLEFGSPIP